LGLKEAEAKSQKDAAAFYKGKNLVLIVTARPGGGYDTYCRLLAPFLKKYSGATVVVKNVPAAGGMMGANECYTAPANGLTIGIQNAMGSVANQLVGLKGIRYDITKFSWIGRVTTDPRVLVMRTTSPIKTFQQLLNATEPVKIGATGLGSSGYIDAVITKHVLKFSAEIIHGYDSMSEVALAMLRGEVDGTWGSYGSRLSLVEAGEQFIIAQSGEKRAPQMLDIPTWSEFAPSEKDRQILSTLEAMHAVGRPIAGPPGIPKERLEFLRRVFYKIMHEPDFIKSAKKARRELNYLSGEGMQKLATKLLQAPDEDIKQLFIKAIQGDI